MQEGKLSQTESRMLSRWVAINLSLRLDGFYFWRMSPRDAVKSLEKEFSVRIKIQDVLSAIKAPQKGDE